MAHPIGHVNKIPTMQFFSGISRNAQSKLYMLSLTECVGDFQNNALWDTHLHSIRKGFFLFFGKMCFFGKTHMCKASIFM